MNVEQVAPPGQPGGPCVNACPHKECEVARTRATHDCQICGKQIGYQKRFYGCLTGGLVHAECGDFRAELERREL